jgi:uncharacterized protein (DUF924 family)
MEGHDSKLRYVLCVESWKAILGYWFGSAVLPPIREEVLSERLTFWFQASAEVDEFVRSKFSVDMALAARGEYDTWADSPYGMVALLILLDQFPRNVYRGSARAFEQDPKALRLALDGIRREHDAACDHAQRIMVYMPLMHSEDVAIHEISLARYTNLRDNAPASLRKPLAVVFEAASRHAWIIRKFGRYPHRNRALGRPSTAEELEFLASPNSSF